MILTMNRPNIVSRAAKDLRIDSGGFTINELLVVMVILAILAALALPAYDTLQLAREQQRRSEFFEKYLLDNSVSYFDKYQFYRSDAFDSKDWNPSISTRPYFTQFDQFMPDQIEKIYGSLPSAFVHIGAPSKMNVSETLRVYLSLNLKDEELLSEVFPDIPIVDSGKAKVSNRVQATIVSAEFSIEPESPAEQAVRSSATTTWSWLITPKTNGKAGIRILLSAIVPVGNDQAPLVIDTYDRFIYIEIGIFQRIFRWMKEYQVVLVWLAALASAALFVWNRRKEITKFYDKTL